MTVGESAGTCMKCLEYSNYLQKDRGHFICRKCYHIRYSAKKFTNENYTTMEHDLGHRPTLKDLKKYLEKDY